MLSLPQALGLLEESTASLMASAGAFKENPLVPMAVRLDAADTGRVILTGAIGAADGVAVRGTEVDLLAWLLGRSCGTGLAWSGAAGLPRLPSPWTT